MIIDPAYCGSSSWLRSPLRAADDYAVLVFQAAGVPCAYVDANNVAAEPAFKLDLDSIIFASAATADSGEQFSQIASDVPMYLRLNGSGQNMGTAEINESKTEVTVQGAKDTTLVIQGVTGSGANWCYSKKIDSNSETVTVDDVSNANAGAVSDLALTSLENCKVWLEKPVEDGGTLIYAVMATDFVETPDELEKFPEIQEPPSDFEKIPNTVAEEKSTDTLKTGDKTSYFAISALCLTTGSALSVVLGLRAIRKKFRE